MQSPHATQDDDPYGQVYGAAGVMLGGFGFTGEQTDPSGMSYLRARYYDPMMGIFPSLDPFEGIAARPMSLNGYAWVEGNPTSNVDPSGEEALTLGAVAIGLAVGAVAYLAMQFANPCAYPNYRQRECQSLTNTFSNFANYCVSSLQNAWNSVFSSNVGGGGRVRDIPGEQYIPTVVTLPATLAAPTIVLPFVIAPAPNQNPNATSTPSATPSSQPTMVPPPYNPQPTSTSTPDDDDAFIYRVQSTGEEGGKARSKRRIIVDPSGNISIPNKEARLYIWVRSFEVALRYLQRRRNNPGTEIVEFRVPEEVVGGIEAASVPPEEVRSCLPSCTERADHGKYGPFGYGLSTPWITQLDESAIPSSGRIAYTQ